MLFFVLLIPWVVSGQSCPDNNHPHMIDLGLPSGTLWACCNVGAQSPEGTGCYYSWGETTGSCEGKNYFSWEHYKHIHYNPNDDSVFGYCLTKYCQDSEYGYNGFTDELTTLESGDDAAIANWGSQYRMPNRTEVNELLNKNYTSWTVTTVDGVKGLLVTSLIEGFTDKNIFLPLTGLFNGRTVDDEGVYAEYWTSSLYTRIPNSAYMFKIYDDAKKGTGNRERDRGLTIRPITQLTIVDNVSLSNASIELAARMDATIAITSGNGTYSVSSSDENVATATIEGENVKVTATGEGTATITVTDKRIKSSATITVTVYPGLTLSKTTASMITGEEDITVRLTGGSGSFTVTSSNTNVATATFAALEDGGDITIHAAGAGTTTITVTDTKTGDKATMEVTVFLPLQLAKTALRLYPGYDRERVIIKSGNGTYTIKSSNTAVAIATVSGNTVEVAAVGAGSATITLTDTKIGKAVVIAVSVIDHTADPLMPSSPVPANGASDVSTSGSFVWLIPAFNGGKTTRYDLYLDTDSRFSHTGTKPYKSGTGNSCDYSGLEPGTTYYWKVKAYNAKGQSVTSDVWSFTTLTNGTGTLNLLGDVNGDTKVTVSDVMMMVNHILGQAGHANFIKANADVNSDRNINITDVMTVVQIILNGGTTIPYLAVWHKDGTKVMFKLDEEPKIRYRGDQVTIEGATTVEYTFQSIRKMTIERSLSLFSPAAAPFLQQGNTVTFLPAESDLTVSVTLPDGQTVKDMVIKKGETATLPLDAQAADGYKMKVNGVTYKIKTR